MYTRPALCTDRDEKSDGSDPFSLTGTTASAAQPLRPSQHAGSPLPMPDLRNDWRGGAAIHLRVGRSRLLRVPVVPALVESAEGEARSGRVRHGTTLTPPSR